MDNLKLWEIIRAKVVNEDAWIQQRVNWLLVSNGFLFAAFAAVATQGFQTPLFLLVPLIGFALGVLAFIGLRAGARAIDDTLTEWIQLAVAEESPSFYPNLHSPDVPRRRGRAASQGIAITITISWLFLLVSVVCPYLRFQVA